MNLQNTKTIFLISLLTTHYSLLTIFTTHSFAAGLSSPCAAMYLSNLKIGQTYSLQKLLGYPFNVTYKGSSMVDLKIQLQNITTTTADGYEPLPDPDWIRIQKTDFSLDPGQTAETDILITIPDDEKHLGKKYAIYINPFTDVPKHDTGFVFAAALLCGLKLHIAPKPPTAEEIRLAKKQALGGELSVFVTPERIFLVDVPTGRKIDIKKQFNETIKIINSTNEKVDVELQSLPVSKSGLFPPRGYEETENPDWLILKKTKFVLKPNSIQDVGFYISIPEDKKDKKYLFTVSCLLNSKHRQVRHIVRVYADTEKSQPGKEEVK